MERIAKTILLVIGILAAIVAIFFFVFVFSVTSYKTHDNLSPETQKAYAKHALMPELEGRIERYGVAGFQDPDCMIETFKYQSLDDLYVSMPKVKEHMATAEGTKGSDIKGKKVTVYRLEKLYPFNDKTSDFAHLSLIDKDSSQEYYTWYYSVIVYKDGSCRFTVNILPN